MIRSTEMKSIVDKIDKIIMEQELYLYTKQLMELSELIYKEILEMHQDMFSDIDSTMINTKVQESIIYHY